MKTIHLFPYILLVLLSGAFAGYIDLHQSEVQPAVLIIAVSCFVLGFLKPRRAWLAALIVGTSVFLAHCIAGLVGYRVPYPVEPGMYGSLIALIPAFLSAYFGVLAWFFFIKGGRSDEHPRG